MLLALLGDQEGNAEPDWQLCLWEQALAAPLLLESGLLREESRLFSQSHQGKAPGSLLPFVRKPKSQ